MKTICSYLPSFPSIDWKKEAKETLIPATASLATGALVNYTTPTAFAISYIARQCFLKPWKSCLIMVDASISKSIKQIFPSYEQKTARTRGVALTALYLITPFVMGYKVSQYAGHEISPFWWVVGSGVGGLAHALAKQQLQEDPFKKLDIVTINKENYQKEVIESHLPVVVDAYATWCPPCRAMAPIFSEISKELSEKVKFVKFNIDENKELAQQLNIQSVPTFIFFKDGKLLNSHSGGLPKDEFVNKIEASFK